MGTSFIAGIKLWEHKGKECRPPLWQKLMRMEPSGHPQLSSAIMMFFIIIIITYILLNFCINISNNEENKVQHKSIKVTNN